MIPNAALPSVKLVIPSDRFFGAMNDIAEWLAGHNITSPYSTSRQDCAGDHNVCFAFPAISEAVDFARRFDGHVIAR
jgi:hypothetical protein